MRPGAGPGELDPAPSPDDEDDQRDDGEDDQYEYEHAPDCTPIRAQVCVLMCAMTWCACVLLMCMHVLIHTAPLSMASAQQVRALVMGTHIYC